MLKGIKKAFIVLTLVPLSAIGRSVDCSINSKLSVISLSAPITWILYELELLDDPKIDSVSTFHFTGDGPVKKLAGGLFLSARLLSSKKAVVFFDQSKELKAAIKKGPGLVGLEVPTRGKGPFDIHRLALDRIRPYLKNCDKVLAALEKALAHSKKELQEVRFKKRPVVFFLGEFKSSSRPPRLVMGTDGFVKFFVSNNELRTYPSPLHYVSWSSKILNALSPVKVGLAQSEELKLRVKKIEEGTYNLFHAGALSPGLGQIRFMQELLNNQELGFFRSKGEN